MLIVGIIMIDAFSSAFVITPLHDRLEERGVDRGSARRSSLKGRERAIVNQTNIGTVSTAALGKLLRDGMGRIWAFSERIDTILSWTELVIAQPHCRLQRRRTIQPRYLFRNPPLFSSVKEKRTEDANRSENVEKVEYICFRFLSTVFVVENQLFGSGFTNEGQKKTGVGLWRHG